MKILVTGAAGFIGAKLSHCLAERGDEVIGLDNLNDYYDVRLKYARLAENGIVADGEFSADIVYTSRLLSNLRFIRLSIDDKSSLDHLFEIEKFDKVVNLAAQAGVRYSIDNPYSYMQSNLLGFLNILEGCRHYGVKHLIFASSSSVYGMNEKVPFREEDMVDTPVSLYGASKKSNELMAHSYSKLYGFAVTGLRFFTVYGPWGRPDMAPFLFADAIRDGKPIKVYNNGDMSRDFTYIDDIVEGAIKIVDSTLKAENCPNLVKYRLYNIGCGHPVKLLDFIRELEAAMGKSTEKIFLPMQPGDVYQTYADTTRLETEIGYHPHWSLLEGINQFIEWYNSSKNPLKQ